MHLSFLANFLSDKFMYQVSHKLLIFDFVAKLLLAIVDLTTCYYAQNSDES